MSPLHEGERGVTVMGCGYTLSLTMRETPSLDRAIETGDKKMAALGELIFQSFGSLRAETGHTPFPVTLERDG